VLALLAGGGARVVGHAAVDAHTRARDWRASMFDL